ncbi:hypothetical protein ABFX02_14G204800 [Erythranthe guttata]
MQPEVTAVNSSLEKPLHQLTEDDIAQVTREDCRRYLKEKGMRRPSWNKSQAIQQVIMLKTLLEVAPDSDSGSRKRLRFSRPNDNDVIPESVPKATHIEGETSVSAEYTAPFGGKDLDKPDSSGAAARCLAVNNDPTLSRTTASLGMPVGQMTIFYCGKVNVYDDVPEDKAQSIMHIAASPVQFPQEQQPVDDTIIIHPLTSLSKAVSVKAGLDSPVALLPALQTVKMSDNSRALADECISLREGTPVEGPSTRKASVQRYLDKRKDRFKSKRKAGITSCTSLDVQFNHQKNNQMPNDFLNRSNTCSPPPIKPPSTPTRCSSVDNDSLRNLCGSTDLNN